MRSMSSLKAAIGGLAQIGPRHEKLAEKSSRNFPMKCAIGSSSSSFGDRAGKGRLRTSAASYLRLHAGPSWISVTTGGVTELIETPSFPEFRIGLVYLDPGLEDQPHPVIVAVVAHEIAHCVVGNIFSDESERAAYWMIAEWGFQQDLNALRERNPNHRY